MKCLCNKGSLSSWCVLLDMSLGRSVAFSRITERIAERLHTFAASRTFSAADILSNQFGYFSLCCSALSVGAGESQIIGDSFVCKRLRVQVEVRCDYKPSSFAGMVSADQRANHESCRIRCVLGRINKVVDVTTWGATNGFNSDLSRGVYGPLAPLDGTNIFDMYDDQIVDIPIPMPIRSGAFYGIVKNPALAAGALFPGNAGIVAGQFDTGEPAAPAVYPIAGPIGAGVLCAPSAAVAAGAMFAANPAIAVSGLVGTTLSSDAVVDYIMGKGTFMFDVYPDSYHLINGVMSDAIFLSVGYDIGTIPFDCVAGVGDGEYTLTVTMYGDMEFDDQLSDRSFKKARK